MSVQAEFIAASLLKRDAFSETQTGHFADDPDTRLTRRRLDRLPLWSRAIGRYLARREARALELLKDVDGVPRLIGWDETGLIRSWVEGVPLQLAGGVDRLWMDDAHRLLRQLHRRGITHNDLAKPQNWLVTPDCKAAVIDMQLATVHRGRGRLFRLARYEDLRHLLKQKRRFAPHLLTPMARRLLEQRSAPSRAWRTTAKPVYNFITRKVLNWSDGEGTGPDLAPRTEAVRAALLAHPGVRDVAIVPFPRPGGLGLYAFVETDRPGIGGLERSPDLLQIVPSLPRGPDGEARPDLLALIAENRVDELDPFTRDDPDLAATIAPIVNNRLNLTDRYIR